MSGDRGDHSERGEASNGHKDCELARDEKWSFPLERVYAGKEVGSTRPSEGGQTGHSDGEELWGRLPDTDSPDRVKVIEDMVRVWRAVSLVSWQSGLLSTMCALTRSAFIPIQVGAGRRHKDRLEEQQQAVCGCSLAFWRPRLSRGNLGDSVAKQENWP